LLSDLGEGVHRRLAEWQKNRVVERIWAKDPTLWADEGAPELVDRLGWLQLPARSIDQVEEYESFAEEVKTRGYSEVVLLGMGGSSLAPEVFTRTVGSQRGCPNLRVLDTTHPAAIRELEHAVDVERTAFVVSSKSGGTLETLSLFRYFFDRVKATSPNPGQQFVAITDPGSSLEALATEREFWRTFLAPKDVGGRYSALSVFGLLPAAILGLDVGRLLTTAHAQAAACAGDDANPGLELGAVLAAAAAAGRDKITFFATPSLVSFPDWIEQLIAESTGKDGRGLVPIVGESVAAPESYGSDRVFVSFSIESESSGEHGVTLARLEIKGHPIIAVELASPSELGAEFFRWEFATAAVSIALNVHPFNQPDVQLAKEFTQKAMEGEFETTPVAKALEAEQVWDFIKETEPGDYLAVQAFIAPTRNARAKLSQLQQRLAHALGAAVSIGFGPRFLHSTGQLHKGGPASGRFVQLVDRPPRGLLVPETDYEFGSLIRAQADGDLAALEKRGRSVARVDLGLDVEKGLDAILEQVKG
jgi:transaldolase/glucose-6-phosphate isomerase